MSTSILPNEGTQPLPEKIDGWDGDRAYDLYNAQNRFLLGKVLTVIDAAITTPQQGKAVKDLIKQKFHDQEKWVYSICTGGQIISGVDGKLEA